MSFGGGFVDSSDVGPVESSTPGWETTRRLNVWQAVRLGFEETFKRQGFKGGSESQPATRKEE